METEVLRHLGYLRDMIKEQGSILGELDHPEGRYDVQLKEASHKITDLWYDNNTKCVMGRLEVLDTENGKKLKEIVNAGYPLYVSSRAAGDVDEKTKEVEIAQIFTYDVVCTPGFKEARLERVNESLSVEAAKYLTESISAAEKVDEKEVIINESVINVKGIALFEDTKVDDVDKPLNDDTKSDEDKYLPTMNLNPLQEDGEDEEKEETDAEEKPAEEKDDEKEEPEEKEDGLTDDEKEENRKLILDVVGLDGEGEPIGASVEDEEKSDSEEAGDDIIDIEAVGKSDDEEEESEEDEPEDEPEEEEEETNEGTSITAKAEKDTKDTIDELESILKSVEKSEEVKESIIRRYPFAISLSESNFAKFASLRPKQKKRCADFIEEHEIFDIYAINELWMTPLREDKKVQQNWLRLASKSDIDLYVAAPVEVQNAIEESAKYVILETQEQVDEFWNRTGLRQAAAQHWINEQRISAYNKAISENREFQANNNFGYKQDYISMTEQWLKDNF